METTMIRIALVLVIIIFGGLLIKTCMDIFGGIRREMEDGTEEWEKLKAESSKLKG